jgi:thiol-disulfide isomerase/thioredoxin
MSLYRNLVLASALALSGCKSETNPYGTQTTVQTDHNEFSGVSHLKSDKVPNDCQYVAVICGKPFDSTRITTFAWMQQQKPRIMSFYHVLPSEPMAKKLGLQEGQTLIYKDGKEVCRSTSTFCDDIIVETGYHNGHSSTPPNGCRDGLVAGKKAPNFEYKNFKTREPVTLKNLEGKVVLLDFWATWCGPCLTLQPHLEKLAGKYPEIKIIGVSVDENPDILNSYLSKKQISYTIVNDFRWTESPTVKAYGVVGIPDLFLIDQKGIIAGRNMHYDLEKRTFTTEKLEAKIKELLKK